MNGQTAAFSELAKRLDEALELANQSAARADRIQAERNELLKAAQAALPFVSRCCANCREAQQLFVDALAKALDEVESK